jgi:uncharacterized membrane protein
MDDLSLKIVQITNLSPTFKGIAVAVVGAVALCFWYWMKKRWNEPDSFGFRVFLYFSILVLLYGLFILIFQPPFWKLPY